MSREPSADELAAVTPAMTNAGDWKLLDRLAWLYATGFGIGLCPKAPGTAGSLLGPLIVWVWQSLNLPSIWIGVPATVVGIAIGVLAADRTARRANCADPGFIVCDEIMAFAVVFVALKVTWVTAILGFVWFRIFDIAKPWPIRQFERLPGGWGIMADDLIAGAFAAAALHATLWLNS